MLKDGKLQFIVFPMWDDESSANLNPNEICCKMLLHSFHALRWWEHCPRQCQWDHVECRFYRFLDVG